MLLLHRRKGFFIIYAGLLLLMGVGAYQMLMMALHTKQDGRGSQAFVAAMKTVPQRAPSPSRSSVPTLTPTPSVTPSVSPSNSIEPTPWVAPTIGQLGVETLSTCSFDPRECRPPYLHVLNTVQVREDRFARLVDSFLRNRDPDVDLRCVCLGVAHVVRYNSTVPLTEEGDDLMVELLSAWPGPKMLLRWEGPYNRVLTFEKLIDAIQTPADRSIVFTVDVDLVFKPGFLPTIYENVERGKTFYAPVFWSLYPPPWNITEEEVINEPDALVVVNNTRGWWRYTSYGMMSFYKSDFYEAGGFPAVVRQMMKEYRRFDLEAWGEEDIAMRDILTRIGLKEVRAEAPGIIHIYHPKATWNTN